MVLDEESLRRVREASERVTRAECELEAAQGEFKSGVRRLHDAGASLREIAGALELSHQRVHQLVATGPGLLRRRGRRTSELQTRSCSFCGVVEPATPHMIAGPGVFICSECVDLARGVVAAGGEAGNARVRVEAVDRQASLKCSFCGKSAGQVRHRLVAGPGVAICGECLDICQEIITERGG